eukprot:symbB.v1.2.001273.t1/scaffold64.1/size360880/5
MEPKNGGRSGFDRPDEGTGFDRRKESEGDAKEEHRRSRGGFSETAPERGHNGDRSRERSPRERSRQRSRSDRGYDGGRSHRSGGGGGGRLAEWQEKDIEALEQVSWQDYEGPLEVVIIDDSPEESQDIQESMSGLHSAIPVHYIYLEERMSIGAKRNLATRSSTAEVCNPVGSGGVNCSGIEVASFYSVPDEELSVRPVGLEPIVFETRLHEPDIVDQVSGQGEGTLEGWWNDVQPLSGAEEPFLYIYLPSSASGGTALNKNRSPPICSKLTALIRALHPSDTRRRGLMGSDQNPSCRPLESMIQRRSVNDLEIRALLAQYPESNQVSTDFPEVAERVWHTLGTASVMDAGWRLVDRKGGKPRFKSEQLGSTRLVLKTKRTEMGVAEMLEAVQLDAFGRRDRGSLDAKRHPQVQQTLMDRLAKALGVEVSYLEPVRVVHYGRPDQAFEQHVDWIVDPADSQLATFGQRIASALIFLSDLPPGVGGETDFPVLGLSVTPKKGTA